MRHWITALALAAVLPQQTAAAAVADSTAARAEKGVRLERVTVYGRNKFGSQSPQMSAVTVGQSQILSNPVFFGEPDVLKALQHMPGVQMANDGTAGIFVRGGDYDQNQITLDGAAIYNAEHLKGFVGAINPDVVQDMDFYRGAFPARYGARLSSIIDIGVKPGDFERYHGSVSASVYAARVQAEGPLWKGHTSFNVAARMSYLNLIAMPVLRSVYDKPDALRPYSDMSFYDLNAKLTHRFNERHTLSASAYFGHDSDGSSPSHSARQTSTLGDKFIDFKDQCDSRDERMSATENSWSNLLASLNWEASLSKRLSLDATLAYSHYDYRLNYSTSRHSLIVDNYREFYRYDESTDSRYTSSVSDASLAANVMWQPNGLHTVRAGLKVTVQDLDPTTKTSREMSMSMLRAPLNTPDSLVAPLGDDAYLKRQAKNTLRSAYGGTVTTAAVYAEDDYAITPWLRAAYGLRFSAFAADGKTYTQLEPRASLRVMAGRHTAIKASYSRMAQGIHRLMSSDMVMATDIWVPVTKDVPIMTSNLYGAGVTADLKHGIEIAVEGYYKTMDNVVEYLNSASYTVGYGDWREMVGCGRGRSYGVELMASKRLGQTTGWVSYTWSKSLRKFDRPGEEIEGGREFYAGNDRRNSLSVNVTHTFALRKNAKIDLTAAWTYMSGRRGTVPYAYIFGWGLHEFSVDKYFDDYSSADYLHLGSADDLYATEFGNIYGTPTPQFTYKHRNNYVLPAIHHLDVSATLSVTHRLGTTSVGLSLYNVYNQKNISSVYLGYDRTHIKLKGVCPFPFMPSVILSHKF